MKPWCRIGVHRYRHLGVVALADVIERCKDCGQGRVFHALSATFETIPAGWLPEPDDQKEVR